MPTEYKETTDMTELSSPSKTSASLTLAIVPPWALALLAVALYPSLLSLFPLAIRHMSEAGNAILQGLWGSGAVVIMLLALGVPLLALWALLKTPPRATPKAIATRRVLHVACAVPPLFTFTRLMAGRAGLIDWYDMIWLATAAGAALLLARARDDQAKPASASGSGALLRGVHGATAIFLFTGFLFVHVLNHAVALWSVELQETWMTALRLWYRAAWVEPMLLGALVLMVLTGVPMMLRNTRTGGNPWRALQSVAGIYIIVFLCSHLSAVFLTRAAGRDTDWIFATGQNGLIAGQYTLIPYYIFSTPMLLAHVALGVRMALLRRGVESARVNKIFSILMGFAGLMTLWVTAAVLGVELAGSDSP